MILVDALCLREPSRVSISPSFPFIHMRCAEKAGRHVCGDSISSEYSSHAGSIVGTPGFDPGMMFGVLTEVRWHC